MKARHWLVAAALLGIAAPASASMSEAEVKKLIEDSYKVSVVRVLKGESGGKAVYRVRIMNPKADWNGALGVSILVVDVETGQILPSYRHLTSGLDTSESPMMRPNRQGEEALSSHTVWR